jgi:hypothetical protein
MILLGCLLAFSIAVAPRVVLVLAWIFSDRWQVVWQNDWVMPLLGILFLPFTTVMYMLAWQPAVAGGAHIEGWDWMWILLGLILDISKWMGLWGNRNKAMETTQRYYPSGAPGSGGPAGTSAAISTGQVPPSSSPITEDAGVEPKDGSASSSAPGSDRPGS